MDWGLYIHIPFCQAKCSYCNFLSVPLEKSLVESYTRALGRELQRMPMDAIGRRIDTIYFGGGTPSLFPVAGLAQILSACREVFDIAPGCEITLEGNPGTIDAENARGYFELGVNRMSIGAQSFHDSELAVIGRIHSSSQIGESLSFLRNEGIDNINLDLILGLPYQSRESWITSLERSTDLGPTHISVYMLEMAPHVPLQRAVETGNAVLPEEDDIAGWYLDTIDFLSRADFHQYEISNFCRSGFPCRHNLKYWRREPVLGVGLGSHSFDGSRRYANIKSLPNYLDAIESGRSPVDWSEAVDDRRGLEERLFLGLRLRMGLDWDTIEGNFDPVRVGKCKTMLRRMTEEGLVEEKENFFRLTPRGMLISNEVFQEFMGL
jgi:oxygen-independent coproporphyrinogen-3 oxidase